MNSCTQMKSTHMKIQKLQSGDIQQLNSIVFLRSKMLQNMVKSSSTEKRSLSIDKYCTAEFFCNKKIIRFIHVHFDWSNIATKKIPLSLTGNKSRQNRMVYSYNYTHRFFAAPNPPRKTMASWEAASRLVREEIFPRAILADSAKTFLKIN